MNSVKSIFATMKLISVCLEPLSSIPVLPRDGIELNHADLNGAVSCLRLKLNR